MSKIYMFQMTKERAEELGLIVCMCGHPESSHSDFGLCCRDACNTFRPRGIRGTKMSIKYKAKEG